MELKDFIPSLFDKEEYKLIIEKHKKLAPIWAKFNKGVITRDEYIAIWEQIHRVYDKKIKELDNE